MNIFKKKPYINSPQHGLSHSEYKRVQIQHTNRLKKGIEKQTSRAVTTLPSTEFIDADGNWDSSRSYPINMIVLHTTVCSAQAAANRFATPNAGASAHYLVTLDGKIWHFLEEFYTAYHAGNYSVNQVSIGIEHEDGGNYNSPRPDSLYAKSAELVADICRFYGITCDRTLIRKHSEVSQLGTACPDSLEVDRIVRQAAAILTPPVVAPNYAQAAKDSAKWVYGYQTMGTVTQRMAGVVAAFKNNNIPKP